MSMDEVPARIKPPECIELQVSLVDRKRIGSFSRVPISKGTEFGPYEGRIVYDKEDESLDPRFSWEVFDLKTFKYLHTVDATNPQHGNWMRYVCCARFFEEQNIVSTQNGSEVFYRALKDIAAGEELLTWFQPKKKKRKRSSVRSSTDIADVNTSGVNSVQLSEASYTPPSSPSTQKRKRKPKVIPDAYVGPLDWEERDLQVKKVKEDVFEPLQPGQKRRRRKKLSSDNNETEVPSRAESPVGERQVIEPEEETVQPDLIKIEEENIIKETKTSEGEKLTKKKKKALSAVTSSRKNSGTSEAKKENGQTLSIAEINNTVEWEFPQSGEEYNFELKKHHVVTESGKKLYKCDMCLGLYKHMFSLKRHYLRNHINYKYLSKSDMTNCLINLAQVKNLMRNKFPEMQVTKDTDKNKSNDTEIKNDEQDKTVVSNNSVENETTDKEDTAKDNTDSMELAEETSPKSVQENDVSNKTSKDYSVFDTNTDPKDDTEEMKNESNELDKEIAREEIDESSENEECNENEDRNTNDEVNRNTESVMETFETANEDYDDIVTENETEKEKPTDIDGGSEKIVPMPGLFRCYTCYLTFDDFESIQDHTQNHPEQTDGACFPCDMCSMRFNYKHNLVRHRKTHEIGGLASSPSKKTSAPVNGTSENSERPSPKNHLLPSKLVSQQDKKPLLLPSVFRCAVCPLKFDTQAGVIKHVKEEHKTGSQFQCVYCGKDFLSMPNMKKHVRFHLGYRATCRICSEAFSNVGALRKHTRVSHPDIYKAKLIERLEKYGVLRGPDKNALSKEVIEKVNLGRKNSKEPTKDTKEPVEIVKKEVKVETNNSEKEEIDNEINFTADEIDDGGSRFKFACTVCKKRFSSYINMCRHRRKVHSNENRHRTEQCLTFGRKPRINPSPIFENPIEVEAFYANISHNIATNLNCYIDGKPESLKTFVDHVKIEDYPGNFGYSDENEQPVDLTWEKYNFPRDFKPVQTISFADIKNVLNIHNDFDSHCMSVDARSADSVNNNKDSETEDNCIEENIKLVKDIEINCDKHKYSTETEDLERCVNGKPVEDSIEDIEVREINSEKCKDVVTLDKPFGNLEVVNYDTMGKSSHGLKALANLGSGLLKRGTGDVKSEPSQPGINKLSLGASISTDSPAAKTFHQVKLGEYANFQDDLLSCDMDSSVTKETQYAKNTRYRHCDKPTEEVVTYDIQTTEKLMRNAQDQLEALYDSIDNSEPVRKVNRKSPKSLSVLCAKVLGLCQLSKKHNAGSSLNVAVASQLQLSTSDSKNQSRKLVMENGPDYSDAPEESPFYNYDSIVFGKNGHIEKVCGVCKKHFTDLESMQRHQTKRHPAIDCSFLEVEQGHEIEDLHFSEPSYVGALAVTDPGLDNVSEIESFKCTNCSAIFKSVSKLHVHVINCSSIDPIYGVQKIENSPTKTPMKKKLQKKIFSLFGNKTEVKSDLNSSSFKLSQQRSETQSPKRVFTGCRKRTSFILPDSPQKLICEQKPTLPTTSGYNPQNHVRRRELTEILDTLTCEACGLKFKTIIILERHVKYCTKKEKFKSIQPMACPLIDESLEKIKNMCLYCNKNFTYTKSLVNHFQDFCPVKRAKLYKGELTEQDKLKESEIIERIQKADEEKVLKQKEIESRPKRNVPWQVGRKSKRKGHSWTNIKKRNQQKQSTGGNNEGSGDNGEYESSESEADGEENIYSASDVDQVNNAGEVKESLNSAISGVSECSRNVDTESSDIETSEKLEDKSDIDECEERQCNETVLLQNDRACNDDLVGTVMESNCLMSKEEAQVAVTALQEVIPPSEITTAVASIHETIPSNGNIEHTEQTVSEKDGPVTLYTCVDINNTSLNCTARYSVNLVNTVKKYRPIAPKPKSLMFQCVSNQIPTSKPDTIDTKKKTGKGNRLACEDSSNIESAGNVVSNSKNEINSNEAKKEEVTFKQAEQGLITGKRKRARVGRVEEFLRNAFKRKRKKIESEQEKSSGEILSSEINPDFPGMAVDASSKISNQVDMDTVDSSQVDKSYLKSKQAEENTLNKISEVVFSKTEKMEDDAPSDGNMFGFDDSLDNNCEQHVENVSQVKNELDISGFESSQLPYLNIRTKRGRGRPRGSSSKKSDQDVVKPVPGRKRGRPRKVQLPEKSASQNEITCVSSILGSETSDVSVGQENNNESVNKVGSEGNIEDNNTVQHTETETLSNSNVLEECKNQGGEGEHSDNRGVILGNNLNCTDTDIGNFTECSDIKPKIDENKGDCNQFHSKDKDRDESEAVAVNFVTDIKKCSPDKMVKDKKSLDTISESEIMIDIGKCEQPMKLVKVNQEDENTTEMKQSVKVTNDALNVTCVPLIENDSGCKYESYDEVDGCYVEQTVAVFEGRTTSKNTNEFFKTDDTNSQKYSKDPSFSEQIVEQHIEDMAHSVVSAVDNETTSNQDNFEGVYNDINKVGNLTVGDAASCINLNNNIQCEQGHSSDCTADKVDEFEPLNEKAESMKEVENEETSHDTFRDTNELESCSSESNINKTRENSYQLSPVLSPSERVKMNKRSCKKDVDLASPVWVKRTKLNKGKNIEESRRHAQ